MLPTLSVSGERRLLEVFNLVDKKKSGSLDDKHSLGLVLRSSGVFLQDSEIDALEVLSLAELRRFVADRAELSDFGRALNFEALRAPLNLLDRTNAGKVRRDELTDGLCSAGDAMSREDVDYVLDQFGMKEDVLIDIEKFLRLLIQHPMWMSLSN